MIHYLFKPSGCFPMHAYETFEQIDFSSLRRAGVKLLLIDLDNTLADYETFKPSEKQVRLLNNIVNQGFSIVIISNNVENRVSAYCEHLRQPYIAGAKKPFLSGFRRAQQLYGTTLKPDEVCVIGDQLLTDVLGASRMGFKSVLVEPLKRKTERWYTRINRKIERHILKRMKRRNLQRFNELGLSRRLP